MKEYALYEGEEILAIGTVKEIADKLKISPDTVKFYGYAAYAKRRVNKDTMRVLVEIEMDGVE